MTALRFIARRLAALLALLLVVSAVAYALMELSPGGPEHALLSPDAWFDQEAVRAIREKYQLDQPAPIRFLTWAGKAARLDLGRSIASGETVGTLISNRAEVTAQLAGYTLLIVLVTGVPLGMLAASRRGSSVDRTLTWLAVMGQSVPGFASGLILIYLFAVVLGWLPSFGVGDGALDRIRHLTLPAFALATPLSAYMFRQTRAASLDLLSRDFMIFARARGLQARRLFWYYAMRNASLPIVTTLGLLFIQLLSGAVLVETVFSVPGLGSLLVYAISTKDVPVQQAITLLAAFVVVITNLVVDLAVFWLDPRTRYPEAA